MGQTRNRLNLIMAYLRCKIKQNLYAVASSSRVGRTSPVNGGCVNSGAYRVYMAENLKKLRLLQLHKKSDSWSNMIARIVLSLGCAAVLDGGLESFPGVTYSGSLTFQFSPPADDLPGLNLPNVISGVTILKRITECLGFCPPVPCGLHKRVR